MNAPLNLQSLRARKARLAGRIGQGGYQLLLFLAFILVLGAVVLYATNFGQFAWFAVAAGLLCFMFAAWYHQDLAPLPPTGKELNDRLAGDVLMRLDPKQTLTPRSLWQALEKHWQVVFITNHCLLPSNVVATQLTDNPADLGTVWEQAGRLADITNCDAIEPGHIAGALLGTSSAIQALMTRLKFAPNDLTAMIQWLGRALELIRADKPYFGGIGRDWANGFTPRLNQFGHNVSAAIEQQGAHFGWLTTSPGVTAIKNAFSQGTSAVALVGAPGVGKTSHVYALAQLLLEEKNNRNLEHRQVIALSPSTIISSAQHPGELEQIVMALMQETAHAGHIILFLDDAQLFFENGPGSFDITQILLPIVQSRAVQLVLAMSPYDYQHLKATRAGFAGQLTPVVLSEPGEEQTMRILEDATLNLEHRQGVLIPYEALREAYRLSGRYDQETAYPGKAIRLLEQSVSYANNGVVTAASVQQAIEQAYGVKVSSASPVEADALLHLEDKIHERMINQTHAVSVVASALRRARAGVSNPKRPIGSFLFLGPTGVGKTELAKAIAATYFGSEQSMVRLDMSEYQQQSDVGRLLADGTGENMSLIMAVRQQPFSVVLLDEIEKAHPNILNLLLQLIDEGQLTDAAGRKVSFKDCIIIATSNAGAQQIRERVGRGEALEAFEPGLIDELISSGQFKPELLNRFDEIVLFRPLNEAELVQVIGLMMAEVNHTLAAQNISVELTPAAAQQIVAAGYDARLGARPMRRMLQRAVEDGIANRILRGATRPGDHVVMDTQDLDVQK